MALREVLAELDAQVRGAADVAAITSAVDRFSASAYASATPLEQLKLKEQQAAQAAQRLAAEIRRLSAAEGDNVAEIRRLELAQLRANAAARQYGAETAKLIPKTHAATQGFEGLRTNLAAAGPVIGAIAVGIAALVRAASGAVALVSEVVELGGEIDDAAQRLGMSTRALQEWRFIGERTGVSAESLGRSIRTLGRNAEAASRGAGPAARDIRLLGVSVRDSSGELRSQEQIFSDTITALAGMQDETRRAAMAQRLFGESGAELVPLMNEGAAGVALLRARFAELGGGLSDDVVAGSAEAGDALGDFRLAMTSLRGVLVADVLPVVTRIVEGLATFVGGFVELLRTTSLVQTALGALAVAAGVFLLAMSPWIIAIAPGIAALGLLYLAVDDVVTAFRGGDSYLSRFTEWVLSTMGTTMTFTGVIEQFGVAWQEATASAYEGLADLTEALEGVQMLFGIGDIDAASTRTAAARGGAADARRSASSARTEFDADELARQAERMTGFKTKADLLPAAPTVSSASRRADRRGSGRQAPSSVSMSAPITINGTDPQAIAREVGRELERRAQEAADTFALAAPELA